MRKSVLVIGFTLIEVLTVLAILSVLAAISFSAYTSARYKARETTCISNMRQIALACQMYRQDYDGKDWGTTAPDFGLPERFRPVMDLLTNRGILLCPNRALTGSPESFWYDDGKIGRTHYAIWSSWPGMDYFQQLSDDPTWPIVSCDLHDMAHYQDKVKNLHANRFPYSLGVSLNGSLTRRPLRALNLKGQ